VVGVVGQILLFGVLARIRPDFKNPADSGSTGPVIHGRHSLLTRQKRRLSMTLFPEPLGVMPSQFIGFFSGKILFFMGMQVFFHLFDDVLGIVVILHFKVRRNFCHFIGMAADRAEFPFLEPVNIGKRSAPRTTEDMIHNYVVMRASFIKMYRCPSPLCKSIKNQTKSLYRAITS
jgi:hypothetical protein